MADETETTETTERPKSLLRESPLVGVAEILRGIGLLLVGGMYLQHGIELLRSADDSN